MLSPATDACYACVQSPPHSIKTSKKAGDLAHSGISAHGPNTMPKMGWGACWGGSTSRMGGGGADLDGGHCVGRERG